MDDICSEGRAHVGPRRLDVGVALRLAALAALVLLMMYWYGGGAAVRVALPGVAAAVAANLVVQRAARRGWRRSR